MHEVGAKALSDPGISPGDDAPIAYMQRTARYYAALGYPTPYRWACFAQVPFAPLACRLEEACVALVTTAAVFDPAHGEQGPGAPYNSAAKFYAVYSAASTSDPDLRISHLAYDRAHTTAADPRSYNPLGALRAAVAGGRIGRLAARFHGAPTNRSQRVTMTVDAPEILRRCRADGVDAVLLVANCPVCHQTTSLVARHLEQAGIATVVMGCARDIVEHCGVPRFCFSDFPLGNAAGRPDDPASQAFTLELALKLLARATCPRTTVQSPLRWAENALWKRDYANIDRLSPAELARQKADFAAGKLVARAVRQATGSG